jgi:hypothetical protein
MPSVHGIRAIQNLHEDFRTIQLSKWFYDTSIGAATGATRCGSFVGGAQITQGVGYQEIRWTRGFTWFRPPERNTLRPRVNEVVLLCLSVRLKSRGPFLSLASVRTFYSSRPDSYSETL